MSNHFSAVSLGFPDNDARLGNPILTLGNISSDGVGRIAIF
jgi:hypothetical protein